MSGRCFCPKALVDAKCLDTELLQFPKPKSCHLGPHYMLWVHVATVLKERLHLYLCSQEKIGPLLASTCISVYRDEIGRGVTQGPLNIVPRHQKEMLCSQRQFLNPNFTWVSLSVLFHRIWKSKARGALWAHQSSIGNDQPYIHEKCCYW